MTTEPGGELCGLGERQLDAEEIPALPALPAVRCDIAMSIRLRLYERARRTGEWQLQHTRATVVGDPAHHVQSPRRATDEHSALGGEEGAQARVRR